MLRKTATVVVAAVLGSGAAIGVAACGEDRKGEVKFEGDAGTETAGTAATETSGTAPTGTSETGTETAPETGTETAP
jgi:hypothetical protein